MKTREEILSYCLTFEDVYTDIPFHDDNWVLARYKKNKKPLHGHMRGTDIYA